MDLAGFLDRCILNEVLGSKGQVVSSEIHRYTGVCLSLCVQGLVPASFGLSPGLLDTLFFDQREKERDRGLDQTRLAS